MFRLLSIGLFLIGLSLATATSAQAPAPEPGVRLGSRIPVNEEPETPSQREAARTLQRFARCLVDRRADLAAAIVNPPHANPDTVRLANFQRARTPMSRCLTSAAQMSANHRLMTGAFAEQLYRKRFASLPPLAAPQPLPRYADAADESFAATVAFANCLIDASPEGADALARSAVGSDEERAAYQTLAGKYQSCLDAGNTLVISRVALRTAMADQLYRRALSGPAAIAASQSGESR